MTEFQSFEPATGALLWEGAEDDAGPVVRTARAARPGWAATELSERAAILRRFADIVRERDSDLSALIARETGKPLWEARTETKSVAGKVDIAIRAYADRTPRRDLPAPAATRATLRHKPHGVLAVLGPYNFPAHLPNGHIVPALLAGNAVVFKPSEKTPAVGALLVELLRESGVPDDVCGLVQGGAAVGQRLVAHEDIHGVLFTGSARGGVAINRALADQPGKIVALEMGGNNPIVVWDAEDLDAAAALVIQSAFLSAGQRCSAARRLIVRDSAADPLLAEIRDRADRLVVDEPFADPPPFMGPVIDNDAAQALLTAHDALISDGGESVRPMIRPHADRPFLTPGIVDVTTSGNRRDDELFGPLLQVIRVDDFDAAIAEANGTRFGLSAALIGGTKPLFEEFWRRSRAGIVNWNRMTVGASSEGPFGGVGLSGNHRPSAYYAADYCAYPVVSIEGEHGSADIAVGLRDAAS